MTDKTESGATTEGHQDLPAAVAHLMETTAALRRLIERENALLESRRPHETKILQGEKLRLTEEYRAALARVRAEEAALLGERDSPIRRQLKAATEAFRAELKRHARILIRLKTVTEGIVRAISEEAVRQRGVVRRYGTDAKATQAVAGPAALSLDRRI
ncbi:MAG: flagellar basal-body protein FlbY [Alphaproteobacteria bacterium]|nr:MAG: flagellar basal-body protein FlbY [Alphaproteobacteria bacterium]